ncbi:hypothetical protein KY084_03325 [Stakelama sp. CBK3Z-3]|uniref:Rap1a immunity protein domain-containing protein n=1 Tax=Stakelama flava TaxID=2860338 RepID=A0ABS6XI88_9SPHN|nr:Rap1a/Tai family immunity protein [Stakelama flava]MBW4329905.1 hypothetical protein [Stakelama flava]
MKAALATAIFALSMFQGETAFARPQADTPPPQVANAGFLTGTQLYRRCTEDAPTSGAFCFAFVAGVHDTVRAYETWLDMREFCPPEKISQGQLRDTFIDYAKAHPVTLNGQAASVLVAAFKEKYPCTAAR